MAKPEKIKASEQRTEAEAAKVRDETLRRMLSTPPKPHGEQKKGQAK